MKPLLCITLKRLLWLIVFLWIAGCQSKKNITEDFDYTLLLSKTPSDSLIKTIDSLIYLEDLPEVFLSRITQPISNYLANAKFSYAEIDSNMEAIAKDAHEKTITVFEDLGFQLLDFRIEGTSFDEETNKRINEISDVQAEAQAAKLAGVDFAELQRLKAMRDAAKNEGAAGASVGMFAGMNMGQNITQQQPQSQPQQTNTPAQETPMEKLKKLKEMFEMELITEEEFKEKKKNILDEI